MEKHKSTVPPEVVFFDLNETLLDLTPLKASVTKALQGREDLAQQWFSQLLQHSQLITLAGEYRNFDQIANAVLCMVASTNNIELTYEQAKKAVYSFELLSPYPEVRGALKKIKAAGYEIAVLTNSSRYTLLGQLDHSRLDKIFEYYFSVESAGLYKPHRHIYRWAAHQMLHRRVEDCMMVAAHGWDVAGAMWSGMRGLFIARPGKALFPMAPSPECEAKDLNEAADYLIRLKENYSEDDDSVD